MDQHLEQRLDALQREHARTRRQLRAIIVVAFCLLVGAMLRPSVLQAELQAPKPGDIRGTSLVIEDDHGMPRARIGSLADGHFGLALLHPSGQVATQYFLAKGESPALQMFDENGKRRVALDVVEKSVSLDLLTGNEDLPVGFSTSVSQNEATDLTLKSPQGEVSLSTGKRGPWLTIKDHDHVTRVALNVSAESGIPILGMNDNKGNLRAVMGAFQEGDKPFGFGVLDDDRMHAWPTRTPSTNP